MAPLPTLLEAAKSRVSELEKTQDEQKAGVDSLDAEIAAKREERSIAAQNEVRELLKQKETKLKEAKTLAGALSLIGKAIVKLQRAVELGLDDWMSVHTEKVKLSAFLRKKLEEDPKALQGLRGACGSGELALKDGSLEFCGDKASLPKLKAALEDLEANYETGIEIDDEDTFSLLDSRDEIGSVAKRHQVNISRAGTRLTISGPVISADKVADLINALLAGKADLDCPQNLTGAAIAKAKEVEAETGAVIAVYRQGGRGGGGIIYVRGLEHSVEDATTALRAWLDEREGAVSEFVSIGEDSARWAASLLDKFRNDAQMMGQKFGIAVKQASNTGELELRGLPDAVAQAGKELAMIIDFYRNEHAKGEAETQAQQKAEEPVEEEDAWGAAPMAEPTPAAW